MDILMHYRWEGNVRELRNLAERLTLACHCDPITPECLPSDLISIDDRLPLQPINLPEGWTLNQAIEHYEQSLIHDALRKSFGNKAKAAELLGIPVSTLKSKLKKYNV